MFFERECVCPERHVCVRKGHVFEETCVCSERNSVCPERVCVFGMKNVLARNETRCRTHTIMDFFLADGINGATKY